MTQDMGTGGGDSSHEEDREIKIGISFLNAVDLSLSFFIVRFGLCSHRHHIIGGWLFS